MPEPLFVMGASRSGTTALVDLLHHHREVALGIERYKRLWHPARLHELHPGLLERERFFDLDDGLTNLVPAASPRWARHYEELAERFDDARYVGDKVTDLRVAEFRAAVPGSHVVAIVRDVVPMAASWQRRAEDPADQWPATWDAEVAVRRWNRALRRLLDAAEESTERLSVVEYDDFFGDPDGRAMRRLLDRLDLGWTEDLRTAFGRSQQVYREHVAPKVRTLPPEADAYVREHRRDRLWRRVRRLAEVR